MVDRTRNRSDRYQVFILEIPHPMEALTEYSDSQGMTGMINSLAYSEEFLDLKEQLVVAFWRLVDTQLTPRQREVLRLYAKGMTQIEIAKKLNVNQSSITKSINGNTDYKVSGGKSSKRNYGGSSRRLLKLAAKDPEIQAIFKRMAEIKQELG